MSANPDSKPSSAPRLLEQVIQEMRSEASDIAVLSDDDNHNAQAAAKSIVRWADELSALVREQEPPTNYNDPRTWAKGTDMPPSQPQSDPLVQELRDWLDRQTITGGSIGDIRRACFMPWDGTWNGIVRDETAKRERSSALTPPPPSQSAQERK